MTIADTVSGHAGEIARSFATTTDQALHAGRISALDAMDSLRSNSRRLRHAMLDSRDGTLRYVRHNPGNTVMLAAAAGIVVLGIAALAVYLGRRD